MRPARLAIGFVIVVVVVTVALLASALPRARLGGEPQAAAMALLEFQAQWTSNGNDVVFSRARWPASIKALRMNSVQVGRTLVGAWKREDGPCGIWWSRGYQIRRPGTNDDCWTLYRTRAFGLPDRNGLTWRSRLAVVTNAPGGLTCKGMQRTREGRTGKRVGIG